MTREEGSVAQTAIADLVAAVVGFRAAVGEIRLALDLPGAEGSRTDRARMLEQLDDYLLPRLRAGGAPLLVVVGGSTGAGKSTLVNSLLGEVVSPAGVLRPTTRAPVLVHHPSEARWFSADRVLPTLARVTTGPDAPEADPAVPETSSSGTSPASASPAGTSPAAGSDSPGSDSLSSASTSLRLVGSAAVPAGLALLDAPDIDSVVEANRRLANQLLSAADLWLFVTTAARYADAVPWELLTTAAARGTEVALVLDRVDPGAEGQVGAHLAEMLAEHGLAAAPVLLVAQAPLLEGLLPAHVVASVADWLTALGGDDAARADVIARTRDGAIADLLVRAAGLAAAADAQRAADRRLREMASVPYADAVDAVLRATSDGTMLRGEVLARWQDVVGTGEFLRAMQTRVGSVRDRLVAAIRGGRAPEPELTTAIGHGLEVVVLDAADVAADRAHAAWRADPAGRGVLVGLELARGSADLRAEVAAEIRAWQADVLALVTDEGSGKRATARALSFGVNGLGAALMVAVFASTGGLTGAEVGIAGGSALLAQRVLEAVFGDDAVRQLARTASGLLAERVRRVLHRQELRFTVELDTRGTAEASGDALRAATARVVAERDRVVAERDRELAEHRSAAAAEPGAGPGRSRVAGALRGAGTSPGSGASGGGSGASGGPEPSGVRGWWRRLRRGGEPR